MNKKILTCLGVIALAGAFGISAAITTNIEYKSSSAMSEPINDVMLRFHDYPDTSDQGLSGTYYLKVSTDLYDLNGYHWNEVYFNVVDGYMDYIHLNQYDGGTLVSTIDLYDGSAWDSEYIEGGGYILRGDILNAFLPGINGGGIRPANNTFVLDMLKIVWDISYLSSNDISENFNLQYPNQQWGDIDIVSQNTSYNVFGEFTINNQPVLRNLHIYFEYDSNTDISEVIEVYFDTNVIGGPLTLYTSGDYVDDFNSYGQYIKVVNAQLYCSNVTDKTPTQLLNNFWVVFQTGENGLDVSNTFTFSNQINYYAPFGENISSDYAMFTIPNNDSYYRYYFYQGWFESGGQLFNRIFLEYWQADGTSYNSAGDVWLGGGVAYFTMFYENTESGNMVIVNQRDRNTFIKNGGYGFYLLKSSTWVAQNYRTIKLYGDVDDVLLTNLNKLNNANDYVSGYVSETDVGLGSAFQLIGTAFSATLPILNIQVVPGITIGLLVFLPLIAGIIILIVWIVKR